MSSENLQHGVEGKFPSDSKWVLIAAFNVKEAAAAYIDLCLTNAQGVVEYRYKYLNKET